jgi:N-acetyl sugar amidotransferase
MNQNSVKVCSRCVMDTTVQDIFFDEQGECKYCKIHDEMEKTHPLSKSSEMLSRIIEKIKTDGKGKKYDCVCGLSGGRDSSYTLMKVVEYGLRPVVISVDNCWGTDISESNIKNVCSALNVDLINIKFDWNEYKDLQRSFFFAGVPDVDSLSDLAIITSLYRTAKRYNLKYFVSGHSFRTEGTSPISWSYFDPYYVKDVQNKFGHIKYEDLKSIPTMSMRDFMRYVLVDQIKEVRLLGYLDYNKKDVDRILKEKLNWQDYGGHHHENKFTYFLQSYYLPLKFNIDKRKTELSAQIRSNQVSRKEALSIISTPYPYDPEIIKYVITRLGFTQEEMDGLISSPNHSHKEFHTMLPIYHFFGASINLLSNIGLLPRVMYLKYCKE